MIVLRQQSYVMSIYIYINTSNQTLKVEVLSVRDMKTHGTESTQQASGNKSSNNAADKYLKQITKHVDAGPSGRAV